MQLFSSHNTQRLIAMLIALAASSANAAFDFPKDHQLHREFTTEWWYLTANLHDEQGREYGIQFTLFAQKIDSQHRLWFAHAAASSATAFYHAERYTRDDMGNAGVTASPWRAYMDHWCMCAETTSLLPATLNVKEDAFSYQLQLGAAQFIAQGDSGISAKNARGDVNSFYYSAPFIAAQGELTIDGITHRVSGTAWLDREWSNSLFSNTNIGWDWLSLRLDTERALLIFWFRDDNGAHLSAYRLGNNGQAEALDTDEIQWKPRRFVEFNGREYPIASDLRIPSLGIELTIDPLNDKQYLHTHIPYWEGAVKTTGSHRARGYLELFGRRTE